MPPVLSAGGGGRGGGGGEGWAVVSTGGMTATGGSAAGVSEDTNWKKGGKKKDRIRPKKWIANNSWAEKGCQESRVRKEGNRKDEWGEGSR